MAFDFDGTLAAIMPTPKEAVLDLELRPLLEELQARIGWLAVVSGRERAFLAGQLPATWIAIGSYGLEWPREISETGYPPVFDAERATADLERARRDLLELSRDLPGTIVETKRWGLSLHFRGVPGLAEDRETWRRFRALALRSGLNAIEGRKVFEMKPRDAVDKGWVIGHLVERLEPSAAIFAGDDYGDVAAWDRLRQLSSSSLPTVAVGVGSTEAPPMMPEVCDIVLPDRSHLKALAQDLLERASR